MLHQGVNAAFEIAITREHARADNVRACYGSRNFRFQRPGIADAGRAAVTDRVETECIEVVDESGFLEVVGYDS